MRTACATRLQCSWAENSWTWETRSPRWALLSVPWVGRACGRGGTWCGWAVAPGPCPRPRGAGLGEPGRLAGALPPPCVVSCRRASILHFYEHLICTQVPVTEKLMLIGKILLSPLERAGHSRLNAAHPSCLEQTVTEFRSSSWETPRCHGDGSLPTSEQAPSWGLRACPHEAPEGRGPGWPPPLPP